MKPSTSTGEQKISSAFNSLNLNSHSPRPSRRVVSTAQRRSRHENRLERQEKLRRDKRLRMSQEIQRKLDEIETRLDELEKEGVELEKTICSMESTPSTPVLEASNSTTTKEKLEQELYNLIHEKNLLTRVENELTIQ